MSKAKLFGVIGLTYSLLLGIASVASALEPGEGFVEIGGGKVWYNVMGKGDATPLLLVHGGPGIPSSYMDGMAVLASDRPVIFYDQLGCGHSGPNPDSSKWTIDYYVAELDTLRQKLGLDEVFLYGHSWGSILVAEYMFTKPSGVKGIILAGPTLSAARWSADAQALVETLPDSVQQVIAAAESSGSYDSPAYQAAVMDFYGMYLARKQPWSAGLNDALQTMNPGIYTYVCGPSEFALTGTLKDYDCTKKLGSITVPTLFVTGEFDEARPTTVEYYKSLIPNAQMVVIKGAAHLEMHDQPELNAAAIRKFMHKVEGE